MKNPFVYGKEVKGKAFFNRVRESNELLKDIHNGVNVLMFSPRRYGKTSLIKHVLKKAEKEGMITCYCNLYPLLEENDFISLFAAAIGESLREPLKKGIELLKTLFTSLSPTVTIGNDGKPAFSLQPNFSQKKDLLLDELLTAMPTYAKKKKKQAVIVFDEFQQIGQLPTDWLEKTLRTHFESHANVTYIFLGSRKHLLLGLFNHPKKPFYRSVKHFPLDKMNVRDYANFIRKGFSSARLNMDEATIHYLIELAERHPYYVQFLTHEVWDDALRSEEKANKGMIDEALQRMTETESGAFQNIWDLLTIKQRETLRAISLIEAGELPFSQAFLKKHGIGSAATFRKSLQSLAEKDLIEKTENTYSIQDFLFKRWLVQLS